MGGYFRLWRFLWIAGRTFLWVIRVRLLLWRGVGGFASGLTTSTARRLTTRCRGMFPGVLVVVTARLPLDGLGSEERDWHGRPLVLPA